MMNHQLLSITPATPPLLSKIQAINMSREGGINRNWWSKALIITSYWIGLLFRRRLHKKILQVGDTPKDLPGLVCIANISEGWKVLLFKEKQCFWKFRVAYCTTAQHCLNGACGSQTLALTFSAALLTHLLSSLFLNNCWNGWNAWAVFDGCQGNNANIIFERDRVPITPAPA